MKCIVRALLPPRRLTSGSSYSAKLKDRMRKSFSTEIEPHRSSVYSTLDESNVARSLSDICSAHEWVRLLLDEPLPSPRSKHAAVAVGERMLVVGGRSADEAVGDIQILDTRALLWNPMPHDARGAAHRFVGHFVAIWKSMLVALGGESGLHRSSLEAHAFDLETKSWSSVAPTGDVPLARIGQSVVQVENKLIMFGGEDSNGRMLDELYVLDLESLVWESPKSGGIKPAPRKYHAAGCYAGRYLWIFGGKSYATYYRDVFCLDLITMEWTKEKTKGSVPQTGRARHVGVMVGENFYIVGGENRRQEMVETLVLDVVRREWSIVTIIESMSPLAHDGLSVVRLQREEKDYLVAFGGHGTLLSNQVYAMLVTSASRSSGTNHKRLSRASSEPSIRLMQSPKTAFGSRESATHTGHFQLPDASTSSSSMELSCHLATPSAHAVDYHNLPPEKRIISLSEKNVPSMASLAHDMEDIMTMVEEVVKSGGNFTCSLSPLGQDFMKSLTGCASQNEEFIVSAPKTSSNGMETGYEALPSHPKSNDPVGNNLAKGDMTGKSVRFTSFRKATGSPSPRAASKRFDSFNYQDLDGSRSVMNSIPTGMSKRWTASETDQGAPESAPVGDHYLETALQTVQELHRQVELFHKTKEEQEKDLQQRFRNMDSIANKLKETMHQQERTERKLQESMQLQKETEKKLQQVSQLQRSTERRYQSVKQQKSDMENEYMLCVQQKDELERHLKAFAIRGD